MTTRDTDVVVEDAEVRFRPVEFSRPFVLSGRPLTTLTEAVVRLRARNRAGAAGWGEGSVLLSYPWAWGSAGRPEDAAVRDRAMRGVVRRCVEVLGDGTPADAVAHGVRLLAALDDLAPTGGAMPRLAALVAASAADNALHDAWGRVARRSSWTMYGPRHLDYDLGRYLGPHLAGRYPRDFLRGRPRRRLPVQAVLGLDDDLGDVSQGGRRPWYKVKLSGDPARDARRLAVLGRALSVDRPPQVRLSLDPNEAYHDPDGLAAMLAGLRRDAPRIYAAVAYIEQPFPREMRLPPGALRDLSVPCLMDEGIDGLDAVRRADVEGWSGLVAKTARGITVTLLLHCWARHHGLAGAVQDLTNVDVALAQSAAFAAHAPVTFPGFECNSLQFAPAANAGLAARHPDLVRADDGVLRLPAQRRLGLTWTGTTGLAEEDYRRTR